MLHTPELVKRVQKNKTANLLVCRDPLRIPYLLITIKI